MERHSEDTFERKKYHRLGLWIGGYAAALVALLMFIARRYAKHYLADATPPHLDPTSFQFRFVHALDEQNIHYREVITCPMREREGIWAYGRDGLLEKFRIDGLMDPRSDWVYDVGVRFWKTGQVQLQFLSVKGGSGLKAGLTLTPGTNGK